MSKLNNGLYYRFLVSSGNDNETLKHQTARIHKILSVITWGLLIVSLLRTALVFRSLPEQMGIHFLGLRYLTEDNGASEIFGIILHGFQELDVTSTKWLVFYPHGITLAALAANRLFVYIAGKVKPNEKLGESRTLKLRLALGLTLDISCFMESLYFCAIWTELILRQMPMRALVTFVCLFIILMSFFELIIFAVTANRGIKI
ncbi:MAG: hypothetical protein K6B74_02550 [Ruminococcus sp.]|nr:hypothetical protein [Ruminococcus sp.]